MNPSPTVSVVIPTYNASALLLETLGTVFAQSFTDFEVIVVDDGSPDDTRQQLLALQQQHPQMRVVSQSNAGVGAARNRGIDEARGTYIAFLDHDDWWKPDKLQTQVRFMHANPACIACIVPYAESNTPHEIVLDAKALGGGQGIIRRPFHEMAAGHMLMKTSSILMVHRERSRGLRYGTLRGAIEDVPYQIPLLSRGELGIAGVTILAVWRRHAGNSSGQADYFFHGVRLLREMQRRGEFASFTGEAQWDLCEYLAQQARVAAMTQLPARPRAGMQLYRSEFAHQLRRRRWKFLLGFPLAAARAALRPSVPLRH